MNRTIYIDNLQNEQKERYASKNIEVLTPQEIFDETLEDTDALVVLCELNSDKDGNKINRSDFYGIKLVQDLRKDYSFKGNVLFVSFMKKSFFLQNKVKYGLISFNRGHSFLRLPVNIDTIKKKTSKIVKLDYLSFRDVQLFGSDIKGTVSERLHALDSIENDYEKYHKELLTQLCNYFNIPANEIINKYEQINNTKHEKLSFVKGECVKLLNKYLNEGVKGYEIPKYKWSVLWLDDEIKSKEDIGETIPIIKHLRKDRNIEVIVAGTYEEAMSLWEEDRAKENRIMQIVVDYRLQIENEDGIEYNTNQGYHFIQEIIERDSYVSIIVYSGMPRKFLMESFVQYGKKIQFFSKIDFPIYKISNFIGDEIVVNGDNAWLESNNQPVSASWKSNDGKNENGLKMNEVYFNFKNSVEFNAWNRQCAFVTQNNLVIYNDKKQFTNLNISGSTFTSSPKQQLKKLQDILIARRFAITELTKAYINGNDIIKRKKEIGDYIFRCSNKNKEPNNKSANMIFNRLALTPNFFPLFLLPEEYSWLKYESGLDFDTSKKIDNYFLHLNKIKKIFSEIFKKYPEGYLVSLLDESFYKIKKEDIKSSNSTNYFLESENEKWFYFDKDYQPYIKTSSDIKLIIDYIYFNLNVKVNYKNQLKEVYELLKDIITHIDKNKKTIPLSLKTLKSFINKLPAKTKGRYKEIKRVENLLEEYIRLFEPWELLMPKLITFDNIEEYKSECEKRKNNLINSCIKYSSVKTKWKVYEIINKTYNGIVKDNTDKKNNESINKAIYLGINSWKSERNARLEKIYEKSTPDYLIKERTNDKDGIINSTDYYKFSEYSLYSLKLENSFIKKMNEIGFVPKSNVVVFFFEYNNLPKGFNIKRDKSNEQNGCVAIISFDRLDYSDSVIGKFDTLNVIDSTDFIGLPL